MTSDELGMHSSKIKIKVDDLADGELADCGALKALDHQHAKVKSMKTSIAYLRKRFASEILSRILQVAQTTEYLKTSLETGSSDAFSPARKLYEQFGFKQCGPIGDYVLNPYSTYYEKNLS